MTDVKEILKMAAKVVKEGGIILYPTDTVWGLGCDATNKEAVSRIYQIKKRADSKSLVLLAEDMDMVTRFVKEIPEMAEQLVEVNDQPMTIIYPEGINLAPNVLAEDGSVGIRIPMMDFCRDLCHMLGKPLVSTSANISGEPTPKVYEEISAEIIQAVDYVVDACLEQGSTGKASQIIKLELDGRFVIIRK